VVNKEPHPLFLRDSPLDFPKGRILGLWLVSQFISPSPSASTALSIYVITQLFPAVLNGLPTTHGKKIFPSPLCAFVETTRLPFSITNPSPYQGFFFLATKGPSPRTRSRFFPRSHRKPPSPPPAFTVILPLLSIYNSGPVFSLAALVHPFQSLDSVPPFSAQNLPRAEPKLL